MSRRVATIEQRRVELFKRPIVDHPQRCTSCERVINPWPGRRCKVCWLWERGNGVDAPYDGAEHEAPLSSLSAADRARYGAQVVSLDDHRIGGPPLTEIKRRIFELADRGYTVAAIAREVQRDRKSVRQHLASRQRYDRGVAPTDESSPIAPLISRFEARAFGSDGKRHQPAPEHLDVPCDSCGALRRNCVGRCCASCWHPDVIEVNETAPGYQWETPFNAVELEYWNGWPRRGGVSPPYIQQGMKPDSFDRDE